MRRSSRFWMGIGAISLLALTPALAQDAADPNAPSTQGNVSVTVYNGGTSLVQDIRKLTIASGTSRIEFPDVSAQIRPETVSFAADGATIVEQNFDYDLLTPGKLMEKAVGETITLVRTNPATGAETRERAKVLSVNQGVVVQIGSRIEVLRDDGLPVRAIFDKVPTICARARHCRSHWTASAQECAMLRSATSPGAWAGPRTMSRCSTRPRAASTCRAG